jgi:hypothetical protein
MKFGISEYYKITPQNIVKLADAIVAACTFAGGMTTLNNQPVIGTIIFVIGYFAKIGSGFFGNENDK